MKPTIREFPVSQRLHQRRPNPDRFGENVSTQFVDEDHFSVEATVNLSSNFYGWVFASAEKMKITAPQEAVDCFAAF